MIIREQLLWFFTILFSVTSGIEMTYFTFKQNKTKLKQKKTQKFVFGLQVRIYHYMWLVMIILVWFLLSSWLSDGQFCRVVDDSQNFVECACTHLSVYTAYAETGSFASFNEAFYAAGFICISGNSLQFILHAWGNAKPTVMWQEIMHCLCPQDFVQYMSVSFTHRVCLGRCVSCAVL